jgi:hypothetical protein
MKRRSISWLFLTLVASLIAAECACNSQSITAPATATLPQIPAEYQALYAELDESLVEFSHLLTVQQGIGFKRLTFAAELLPANANRGETLLSQQTLEEVREYLDALQSLGAGGVSVNIAYPVLTTDFPHRAEYIEFYKQVASLVRQHNMKLLVGTGIVFADPTSSSVEVDHSALTLETFAQGMRQQIETILGEIQPDYLTILNVPDTLASITGLDFSLDNYVYVLDRVTNDIDRGNTALGAGAGNWNDLSYIEYLAKDKNIDYIDMHIYPIQGDNLLRTFEFAETARLNNKRLVIGEAWLDKSRDNEPGGASAFEIDSRDVFSFWAPLDQQFLILLVRFAKQNRVEFVSAYWSTYFFAYLDYESITPNLLPGQLMTLADQAAAANILAGNQTQTGKIFLQLTGK